MEFIFHDIDILAVLVFIFATLFVTEFLKSVLCRFTKFCALLEIGFYKLCISWIVGAIMFYLLHLTLKTFPVNEKNILQFATWTAILNGGYWILPRMLDYLRNIFSKKL